MPQEREGNIVTKRPLYKYYFISNTIESHGNRLSRHTNIVKRDVDDEKRHRIERNAETENTVENVSTEEKTRSQTKYIYWYSFMFNAPHYYFQFYLLTI